MFQIKEAGLDPQGLSDKQHTPEEEGDTTANEELSDDDADVTRSHADVQPGRHVIVTIGWLFYLNLCENVCLTIR